MKKANHAMVKLFLADEFLFPLYHQHNKQLC